MVFGSLYQKVCALDVFASIAFAAVVSVPERLFLQSASRAERAGSWHALFNSPGLWPRGSSCNVHKYTCIVILLLIAELLYVVSYYIKSDVLWCTSSSVVASDFWGVGVHD